MLLLVVLTSAALLSGCGTSEPPLPDRGPPPSWLRMGVVAGSHLVYEQPFVAALGARSARLELDVSTPAEEMDEVVDLYARAGIRPLLLAGFHGRLPTSAEARNLGGWAARFGPGGAFWAGKRYPPGVAVDTIEFGNETSYSSQYEETDDVAQWWTLPAYAERARTYALRFAEAQRAIEAANEDVGLLAIGEGGDGRHEWMRLMFDAVPDLGSRAAGWTVHPYGPSWQERMDSVLAAAERLGAPRVPLHVTEWGLASDGGRCLEHNGGWAPCMTYDQAASTARQVIAGMQTRYGRRLAAIYVYHAHDLAPPGESEDPEDYFGALRENGEPKGGYTSEIEAQLRAR
jgi:hypothetical protein